VLTMDYSIYAAQTSAQLFSATRRIGVSEAEAAIDGWLTGGELA
jgi:hypothetical protein